ncbi:RHS repeat-associated core domain-containing protein [Desulfogranum japonicum]|uniref:RHS repeat-associated core domain-containing protein n=1 Tax=Desulfogranum japonicum TaxID=231447 RepID=UPI001969D1B4|nr:RHS repeat-associated core domain-containing protein [Desulfogranum japonicum]
MACSIFASVSVAAVIQPEAIDFGPTASGATTPAYTVQVYNPLDDAITLGQVSMTGSYSHYVLSNDTCSLTSLNSHSQCSFQVAFKPLAAGPLYVTVEVPSNNQRFGTGEVFLKGFGGISGTSLDSIDLGYLNGKTVGGDFVLLGAYSIPPTLELSNMVAGKAYLMVDGAMKAQARTAFHPMTYDFALSYLLWQTPSGTPITQWSQVLPATGTHSLRIAAVMRDSSLKQSDAVTVSLQSSLQVSASTPNQTFPVTGKDIDVDFVGGATGGTPGYVYKWYQSHTFIDGEGDLLFSSSQNATDTLGTNRLDSGLTAVVLQVADQNNRLAYKKLNLVIDRPQEGGSNGTLVRNVNVANGNLHLEATDMTIGGKGLGFSLSRSYDSFPSGWESEGRRWLFNVEQKVITNLSGVDKGAREVQVRKEGGAVAQYFKDDDGAWYTLNAGNFDKLVEHGDGSFTLYTTGQIVFEYDSPDSYGDCRLLAIKDRAGNTLALNYTGSELTSVTDTNDRTITFTYTDGLLTEVRDFTDRYVSYRYDAEGNLISFRNLNGNTTAYHYNTGASTPYERKLLTGITDPRGNDPMTLVYDSKDRVSTLEDALGYITKFVYAKLDGAEGTVVVMPIPRSSLGFKLDTARSQVTEKIDYFDWQASLAEKVTSYTYPVVVEAQNVATKQLATEVKNRLGQTVEATYDSNGRGLISTVLDNMQRQEPTALQKKMVMMWETENDTGNGQVNLSQLTSVTDLAEGTISFEYDDAGNPTRVVNALGHESLSSYLPENKTLLQSNTDAEGNITAFAYDADGNLSSVTDAAGFAASSTYDQLGRVATRTDRRGNTTSYNYDDLGNVTRTTDQRNNYTFMTYDGNSNLITRTDKRGNTTTYGYDAADRLITTTVTVDATPYTTINSYDALGRLVSLTNAKGHTTTYTYDERGRRIETVDGAGVRRAYEYDAVGNMTSMTGPNRADTKTRMVYDDLNRLIRKRDHVGHVTQYEYDINGRINKRIDANGNATTYSYDAVGRLVSVVDGEGNETTATYDRNGNLSTVTDPNGNTTTYQYDALNRVVLMENPEGHQWEYNYYRNGLINRSTFPDGTSIKRDYDNLNRLKEVLYKDAANVTVETILYDYDENGNRISMSDSSGTTTYTYDELNRLATIVDSFGQQVRYTYDGVGNITSVTYPGNKVVSYTYDEGERMHTVTDWLSGVTTYDYNGAGAINSIIHRNGTKTELKYLESGFLKSYKNLHADGSVISSHTFTRDNNGNPIEVDTELPLLPQLMSRTSQFTYDTANRILTKDQTEYTHDTPGRLIAETCNGQDTTYTYNHLDLITSITNQYGTESMTYNGNGERISRTAHGNTMRYVLDPNRGLTKVLAEADDSNVIQYYYIYGHGLLTQIGADDSVRTYHFDPTGHTLALTDDNETVTDKYAYSAYGETSCLAINHNPFRYVGREGVMDDENGLLYMRARYYLKEINKFMSLDPVSGHVGLPQSLNMYAYVNNNPMVAIDPSGKTLENIMSFSDQIVKDSKNIVKYLKIYKDESRHKKVREHAKEKIDEIVKKYHMYDENFKLDYRLLDIESTEYDIGGKLNGAVIGYDTDYIDSNIGSAEVAAGINVDGSQGGGYISAQVNAVEIVTEDIPLGPLGSVQVGGSAGGGVAAGIDYDFDSGTTKTTISVSGLTGSYTTPSNDDVKTLNKAAGGFVCGLFGIFVDDTSNLSTCRMAERGY